MARKPIESPYAIDERSDAESDPRVRIVITCNHIYVPLDDEGNVPPNYADLNGFPTSRVERRTRLLVPADMAAALSKADRAEVL